MSTFQRVATWNQLCAKSAPEFGTPEYYDVLYNQSLRIKEELEELQEAITNSESLLLLKDGETFTRIVDGLTLDVVVTQDVRDHWNQEILDAGCDLDVVVAGANFLSGHEYDGAIDAVLNNNDVKYTGDHKFAQASCGALGEGHAVVRVQIDASEMSEDEINDGNFVTFVSGGLLKSFVYSVHRTSDDKICKLIDHPKVDLSPFVTGYVGYTKEMLAEFTRLVNLLDSDNQADRAEGRIAMPTFVDKHSKDICDKMFLTLG